MCPNRRQKKKRLPASPIPGTGAGAELIPLIKPYIRHCGHHQRLAWDIPSRKLLDYLIVHIASGKGLFTVAGTTTEAGPGDLYWIPPNTPHTMEGFAPSMELAYAHFDIVYQPATSHWDFTIPGGMLDLTDLQPLMHGPVHYPPLTRLCGKLNGCTNDRVGHLLRELCAEAVRAQPYGALRMSGLMLEIIAEILRGQEGLGTTNSAHIPVLEKAASDLRSRCNASLSLDAIARQHGISPSHFRQLFQKHFGVPPRTYLRRARISKACGLMMGSSMTLSEIAVAVGFETVHSFSKAFRSEEGLSPSQYRRAGQAYTRVSGRDTPYPH
jgi:AraC-like DNA-binding protein